MTNVDFKISHTLNQANQKLKTILIFLGYNQIEITLILVNRVYETLENISFN